MGDFFKGWRRKAGLVTLAMACVFMAAGILGTGEYAESVEFLGYQFVTGDGDLELYDADGFVTTSYQLPGGEIVFSDHNLPLASVHYLFLVLPLTLLSAYLILWRPRKAKDVPQVQSGDISATHQ